MNAFFLSIRTATKSAIRHFSKNRLYGTLNILGLAIAFTTLIMVCSYLYQECNYEAFHSKADRIYRPTHHLTNQSGSYDVHFARIPNNFVNELPHYIPEIEKLIRFQNKEQKYLRIGEKRFKPKHAYITDHDVFEVFDLPFIEGDPETALQKPNSIVLTQSTAQKYFSQTNIIGKEIMVTGDFQEEEKVFLVTGVIHDLPVNTHLPIEILFSFESEEARRGWAYIYTLLAEGSSIKEVATKTKDFLAERTSPESPNTVVYEYQALKDIHLNSQLAREIVPNGQMFYVKIFAWIGLLVWLIALINFANLNTALVMSRGKEVGMRKVLGASRSNLILAALSEAVVYSFMALIIGLLLSYFLFPAFNNLTGIVSMPPLKYFIPSLIILAFISGILAGLLPSILLSSIQVLNVIKQGKNWKLAKREKSFNLKRVMITLQFTATIILLGSAFIAYQQFNFIQTKNLGLKSEQIIGINDVPDKVKQQYAVFKNRLNELSGVKKVSACMQMPSSEIRDAGPTLVRGINEDASKAPMMDMQIFDQDFVEMMELEFVAGKNFTTNVAKTEFPQYSEEFTPTDYLAQGPRKYLINETAMRQLGWENPEDAMGKEINWSIGPFQLAYGPIEGVVKDFHQESLKNKVDPLLMTVEPIWYGNVLIKVETRNIDQTISEINAIWNDLFPYTLEFHFLDELFNQLYSQDRLQLQLLSLLTLIAILISFLGLISLVAFALNSRSKELAIRRVIGADLKTLATLIGKEYFYIIAIASIIGIPFSYYFVTQWLDNFAYRIDISFWPYIAAVILIYVLLFVTIYLQTHKATIENPVVALREE